MASVSPTPWTQTLLTTPTKSKISLRLPIKPSNHRPILLVRESFFQFLPSKLIQLISHMSLSIKEGKWAYKTNSILLSMYKLRLRFLLIKTSNRFYRLEIATKKTHPYIEVISLQKVTENPIPKRYSLCILASPPQTWEECITNIEKEIIMKWYSFPLGWKAKVKARGIGIVSSVLFANRTRLFIIRTISNFEYFMFCYIFPIIIRAANNIEILLDSYT